jgi:Coenzyme PQQ synthesis protein D (PqqD)
MTDMNPRKADSLEINEAEDGLVVYDPGHDMVHHLNPSAALIFDLCDGTRDADEIARVLAEAWSLQDAPIDDVRAGLEELTERKLIG